MSPAAPQPTSPVVPPSAADLYRQANRALAGASRAFDAIESRMGISDSALDILLALLDAGDGCLQRDICAYSFLSKQTVNSSVHRLEKQGILRLEQTPGKRGVRVFLTPAGRAFVDRSIAPIHDADVSAFAALSEADQQAFARAAQAYLDNLRERLADLPERLAGQQGDPASLPERLAGQQDPLASLPPDPGPSAL